MKGLFSVMVFFMVLFTGSVFITGCGEGIDNEPPPAEVVAPPAEDEGPREYIEEKYEQKREMKDRSKNLEDL